MTSTSAILVVGRNGQLARELERTARYRGRALAILGRDQADVTDATAISEVVAAINPKVVINAAAYTAVDQAESEPTAAFRLNDDGVVHLANACRDVNAALIHVSTDYVFDGRKRAPYTEQDEVSPINVYGQSKAAGEAALRSILAQHVILRTSWLYSAFGHNFVKTMLRVGAERRELRIVTDQYGNPTAAHDLAAACLDIADRLMNGPNNTLYGTFHCTGSGWTSWYGLAEHVFAVAERTQPGRAIPTLEPVTTDQWPTAAARPQFARLSCDRLSAMYGITVPPWQDSLARVVTELLDSGW
ncbi:dTDP-4-dehydrorhamnose reductase [Limimonas halophila]|uniref:dTDP-4-dehydrorhamnose reductase n=1 Tax=Limimonas halophila TaxID=1082479 RepID=A0A1G7NRE9_9PROT|nr:dTDP-4-dehydrorhamnose reductase [Limimonas halophila]SDF76655.1 dTDP-4-dehydrorhamnose reductase [Limimonas halophila]